MAQDGQKYIFHLPQQQTVADASGVNFRFQRYIPFCQTDAAQRS